MNVNVVLYCCIKIVFIFGLVIESEEMFEKVIFVGGDIVCFNMVYVKYDWVCIVICCICIVFKKIGCEIVIMMDIKGLEICIGDFDVFIEF